jgi:HAD superfamily hydrolase (TIGR01484 family)
MRARRVLVLDVDGTLVHGSEPLDSRLKECLERLSSKGWLIALATGRRLHMLDDLISELPLTGVISSEGATIFWNGEEVTVARFAPGDWLKLVRFGKQVGLSPIVCSESSSLVDVFNRDIEYASSFGGIPPECCSLESESDLSASMVLYVTAEQRSLDAIARTVSERFMVNATVSAPGFVSVSPLGVSKGAAVNWVLEHPLRGEVDFLVVAGDSLNDLSMVQIADHSIVMPSAPAVLLNLADEIADPIGRGGLLRPLHRLMVK